MSPFPLVVVVVEAGGRGGVEEGRGWVTGGLRVSAGAAAGGGWLARGGGREGGRAAAAGLVGGREHFILSPCKAIV